MKASDLKGQRFGMLTVIERAGSYRHDTLQVYGPPLHATFSTWLCKCDCGREKVVLGTNLKGGRTKSCGCMMGRYRCSKNARSADQKP